MIDRRAINGLILIDKPAGITSHAAVAWLRRTLRFRHVGHAGTLDPLASGLLPCLLGTATRLVQYLQAWPKTYVGLIALGGETETGDAESLPVRLDGGPAAPEVAPPPIAVRRALTERLSGTYLQVPPAFSAKKVGGVRAHRLARQGFAPVLPAVEITVHRLRLIPAGAAGLAFAARVSSGTYLRSLARDAGRICGTGGYLAALRRTGIGPLRVGDAVVAGSAADAAALLGRLIAVDEIPLPLPEHQLDDTGARVFCQGGAVAAAASPSRTVRALTPDGRLAGIGEIADGLLRPRTVLLAPPSPVGAPETDSGAALGVAGPDR